MRARINQQKSINCSVEKKNNINSVINPAQNYISSVNNTAEIQADLCNYPMIELKVVGEGVIKATTDNRVVTVVSLNYTHEQAVASNTWVINHNLNKNPSITVVDSAETVIMPNEIIYNNENTMTVFFLAEFSGKAFLN